MDWFRLKKLKCLTQYRIGILMISVVVIWGIYLLMEMQSARNSVRESDYLKTEIIKLSRKYVHALSKEKNAKEIGSTSNQQTAVLLNNMLDRIEGLEDQLQLVIVNSTSRFSKLGKDIQTLNLTILKERNKTWHMSGEATHVTCIVPNDPLYPHCSEKVKWLQENWKSKSKYKKQGVNGTICSFLVYLSLVEDSCPRTFQIVHNTEGTEINLKDGDVNNIENQELTTKGANKNDEQRCLHRNHDPAYPDCNNKIQWMKKFWKSEPKYAGYGVDGSICSFVKYLSEVESFCPPLGDHAERTGPVCAVPKDPAFPNCKKKVEWLKKFWTSDPCYGRFGVNGTVCSFVSYLGQVESFCPLLPAQQYFQFDKLSAFPKTLPILSQTSLDGILDVVTKQQMPVKVQWMAQRIKRLWPDWLVGFEKLHNRVKLDSYNRKKILIYIGLLADEGTFHFAEEATKGGPLGEFVQWSDTIAVLYLLGHDITLSLTRSGSRPNALNNILSSKALGLCPSAERVKYDVIYTDYIGLRHMIRKFKGIQAIKCRLRVVDSFGTEAQYNHNIKTGTRNLYGFMNLNLQQYYTMFPHSPDNTFLGFTVANPLQNQKPVKKKPIALVYGKHISMWKDPKKIAFLEVVHRYFEVHATVSGGGKKSGHPGILPSYIKNHGVLKGGEYQKLLRESKLFVGLGFPYEGPAALEAIASGCFFLNVRLVPPLGRGNNEFFKHKPTDRKLTSQHPYAETFIGLPYVYTVDVNDKSAVKKVMEEIKGKTVKPYLPFEFTYEGMLERLYAFTKHQNFCNDHGQAKVWPVLSAKQVFTGEVNQGCDDVCSKRGLICEPAYFPRINNKESLPIECKEMSSKAALVAPAVVGEQSGECVLQLDNLFYSCTAKSPFVKRICPCRDYVKGQTALCKDCLN